MNPIISVIVPCWNNEITLERTVDSVLNQTFQDFELLLIDDGSQDETLKAAHMAASQDSRIHVFHKENGGVSSARNMGIQQAQGKWLFFLDADDFLEPYALQLLLENAGQTDICCAAYSIHHLDSGENEVHGCHGENLQEVYESLIRGDSALNSMCARLYRTDLIRNGEIWAPEGVAVGEDVLFNLKAFSQAKSWNFLPDIIYRYELGGDSAMVRARKSHFESNQNMMDGIHAFIHEHHLETELFRAVIDLYIRSLRVDLGRGKAALALTRSDVSKMEKGVRFSSLPAKQKLYYLALKVHPAFSAFIP